MSSREKDMLRAIELMRMAQAMLADAWVGYVPYTDKHKLERYALKDSERLVGESIAKVVEAHALHKSIVGSIERGET